MLYIFAGFPGWQLAPGTPQLIASGLEYAVDIVEGLAIVEKDANIQCRKEGVFTPGSEGEYLYPVECRISEDCLSAGITWDWFPKNWSFGSGVTIHKTSASPDYRIVVHGTDLNLAQFLAQHGTTNLAELAFERQQINHEGWEKYESRWLPRTCPQENHIVHLTWLTILGPIPDFAYQRLHDLIENGAEPKNSLLYRKEDFSNIRAWNGKPAHGGTSVIPLHS